MVNMTSVMNGIAANINVPLIIASELFDDLYPSIYIMCIKYVLNMISLTGSGEQRRGHNK